MRPYWQIIHNLIKYERNEYPQYTCRVCGKHHHTYDDTSEHLISEHRMILIKKKRSVNYDHRRRIYPKRAKTPGRYKYKLSPGQQEWLLKQQECGCAICYGFDDLQLDYDSQTKQVRGYLCRICRIKLINMTDEQFRAKALEYLKNPPAQVFYT